MRKVAKQNLEPVKKHGTTVQKAIQPDQAMPVQNPLMTLQKQVGNQAVLRLMKSQNPDSAYPHSALKKDQTEFNEALKLNKALKLPAKTRVLIRQTLGLGKSDKPFNSDDVRQINQFQLALPSCGDLAGFIGPETLWGMVQALDKNRDSAIALIMTYYPELMFDEGGLESIKYNNDLLKNGRTDTVDEMPPCKSSVEIGPGAFHSIADLTHAIGHEMQHVRENKLGIKSGEFLSEAVEILGENPISGKATSRIWPEENTPGFLDDVKRAYDEGWNLEILQPGGNESGPVMSLKLKKKYEKVFKKIRKEIIRRYKIDLKIFRAIHGESAPPNKMPYFDKYKEAMEDYGINDKSLH